MAERIAPPPRRPPSKGRRGAPQPKPLITPRIAIAIGAVVVVALAVVAIVALQGGGSKKQTPATALPPAAPLVAKLAAIPASTFKAVGSGSAAGLSKLVGAPSAGGKKPLVLYYGAEFCPYCATERWAMITALERFGTFSGLKTTTSAANDVYPNTPTFTFYGSKYASPYVDLQTVEYASNKPKGSGYETLQNPTPAQARIVQTYDQAPYVSSPGAIPFVYLDGRYVLAGAQYKADVLQGQTWNQIANAAQDPGTDQGLGIVGAANWMTAGICAITNDEPAKVCKLPYIQHMKAAQAAASG